MAKFTWVPDYGLDEQTEPAVLEARFGDGYALNAPDGINNMLRKWGPQFNNISEAMANDIVNFLRDKGGWKSFQFDIPDTNPIVTVNVVCKSWSKSFSGWKTYNVRATFEEKLV